MYISEIRDFYIFRFSYFYLYFFVKDVYCCDLFIATLFPIQYTLKRQNFSAAIKTVLFPINYKEGFFKFIKVCSVTCEAALYIYLQ